MRNGKLIYLTQGGMIAAVYAVLTIIFAPLSFGYIQIRISEMLTILPVFTPAAVPGLFAGCLIGNIAGGAPLPDVISGSLATLAGALGTRTLRKKGLVPAAVPPVIANSLIVPLTLKYAYGLKLSYFVMMLTVGAGEIISCGFLGVFLGNILNRTGIFDKQ